MFYDLNVPYAADEAQLTNTLNFLAEVGYTTVALSQTMSGKLPQNLTAPQLPSNAPKSLTLLTRLNLILSDPSQSYRMANLIPLFSIVAVRPTNEKSLLNACTNLDCDLISLDLSVRLPFHFKFKTVSSAISRGIRFEICYSPGITGSGLEARRNLIGNAMSLIRATRGRGIIISSEAKRALAIRAPMDVVNLACVWGLSSERGKEAVCEEARKVVALSSLKRTSYRGVVDVVNGGERQTPKKTEDASKNKVEQRGAIDKSAEKLKRKASLESTQDDDKPLSKREMKRRAKKARLEANSQP
ncbi:ribonuclease P complex subunit Pop2, putative [Talaromyces stipitatus ATCC 10500]|uniref:Ribonuclease P complex subunit Pop2, putative n=1 Tax=Talaromyces stipitatus (strain ATCC 10500 / CBS 375.48 / QM 6759 / NRRL 1006) TaxID=441959 RepID=B8MF60_TALSN|nr:ribonuclease P complex subunit Pop2, putative [Talaromyces stipitatus ATCC 10500]EED16159.1 ribonuclease P complex subunit Pop2, putative [Talaromyces stipitatus ATCC 10500]